MKRNLILTVWAWPSYTTDEKAEQIIPFIYEGEETEQEIENNLNAAKVKYDTEYRQAEQAFRKDCLKGFAKPKNVVIGNISLDLHNVDIGQVMELDWFLANWANDFSKVTKIN